MGFNPSYLPAPDENNRQALIHNIQDDLMKMDEFKALALKLPLSDSGLKLVFAYSFADKLVQEMSEHNQSNYQALLSDAVVALDIMNSELERIVSAATGNLTAEQVLGPIIDATYQLSGMHPVLRFCDERYSKGVIERVEDMIDSLHDTILKVESIMGEELAEEDEVLVSIH